MLADAFTVKGKVSCLLVAGKTATIAAVKRRFTDDGVEFVNYVLLTVFDMKHDDMATVVAVTGPGLSPARACEIGAATRGLPLLRGGVVVATRRRLCRLTRRDDRG